MRILDTVEDDDQRGNRSVSRQIGNRVVAGVLHIGHDTLMQSLACETIEDGAVHPLDGHLLGEGQCQDVVHSLVAARGDAQTPDASCTKRLDHRIEPVNDHEVMRWR